MIDIFHLSLSVSNLAVSRKFYEEVCGARVGRIRDNWLDVWLFGAQITLYQRPAAVIPNPFRQGHHFGATLLLEKWKEFSISLQEKNVTFRLTPKYNSETGVAKMMLEDPDGYLIEIKAYDNPDAQMERP